MARILPPPKMFRGKVDHASRAAAILPPTRPGPGRSPDRGGREELGAAAGPDRQDQDPRQAATRAAPPRPAAPEPAVPALGRVLGGQRPASPLILLRRSPRWAGPRPPPSPGTRARPAARPRPAHPAASRGPAP